MYFRYSGCFSSVLPVAKSVKSARMPLNWRESLLLAKCLMDLKEGLAKATLALFVLSILTSAATMQVANAVGSALWLNPTMGQAGESVDVYGTGFKPFYPVYIIFQTI